MNDNRDRLRQAAQFIKQGDHTSAQAILRDFLKATPNDADAWYLNSFASHDQNWQIKSLERVLLIAPDHEKAQARLTKLRGTDAPLPTPVPQPTKAAVTAKAPLPRPAAAAVPTAPSSRLMLVVGGLVGLVVVILGVVFLLSRPGTHETRPMALAPTASPVIVTRKPTEELPTEMSTATATIINPTFVPTSIRPPTATPTETQVVISVSLPAPALPTDISGVGGGTGRILYKDLDSGGFKLVDVRDGTTSVLALPIDIDEAVWASDGLHIMVKKWTACMGYEPVNPRDPCLGFANAAGSSVTMMPNFPIADEPVLSPDNRQVAFVARGSSNYSHLWVANIDGTNLRQLTDHLEGDAKEPAWSPDGRYIVYSLGGPRQGLHIITSDGTIDRFVVQQGSMPSWSPDGRSLTYIGWPGLTGVEVFVANVDGTNAHAITEIRPRINGFAAPDWPTWSPDGTFIAYTLRGTYYMIRADGSLPPSVIVDVGAWPLDKPSWQPLPASAVALAVPTAAPTATLTATPTLTPTATPVPPTLIPSPTPPFNPANAFPLPAGAVGRMVGRASAQLQASGDLDLSEAQADAEGHVTVEGTSTVSVYEDGFRIHLLMDGTTHDLWTFAFAAPNLEVGRTYDAVVRFMYSDDIPSLEVTTPGSGCNVTMGQFTIEQADLVVSFTEFCGNAKDRKLSGTVTFRAE